MQQKNAVNRKGSAELLVASARKICDGNYVRKLIALPKRRWHKEK